MTPYSLPTSEMRADFDAINLALDQLHKLMNAARQTTRDETECPAAWHPDVQRRGRASCVTPAVGST